MMWPFGSGKRNLGKLLATGQLTSYGSGTGVDDGALKKGIVKRYTILTTGQYSGSEIITMNGKQDTHSNNCVFDDNTGLMWSRYVSASVGPASDGKLPWTTNGNGEGIFLYADYANQEALGGHTDWRIPNDIELLNLRDMEVNTAAPDAVAFPSFPSAYMWTSTTRPSNTLQSMQVGFAAGDVATTFKTTTLIVPLVRG